MGQALTEIQARLVEALRRHAQQGIGLPTYRELCAEFGWASTGTVRDHLRALVRKGYLEQAGHRAHRQLRLRERPVPMARVPVLGRVAAGTPIFSEENFDGTVAVPLDWIGRGGHFVLRVAGDSMIGAGILDGDEVVVRHQQTAREGEIVVATLDGETTLKRLRRRRGHTFLVAANPRFRPIPVRSDSSVIQGVVVGLLRAYRSGSKMPARQVRL